jgi:glycosyltransferase involved in cell wall biosynthesis
LKLLVVCSSLDLKAPLSATPAWWQLLKALYEVGVDVVVTTYHGRSPDSLWWKAYPNPARLEGSVFLAARTVTRRLLGDRRGLRPSGRPGETMSQKAVRRMAHTLVAPRWIAHVDRILAREPDVDAVVFVSVPPNHLRGVARHVRERHRRPVLFYDGDVPASLPAHRGFATGFRIYEGASLEEFDAVVCNSEGGRQALADLGARATHTLYYAADPDVYAPLPVNQDVDVFFYGHTAEYRAEWLRAMIASPSAALTNARFAYRGLGLGDLGRAEALPYLSFSRLREYVARSRINLVITRTAHASVFASSSMRPFELAMAGAAMVSNPCLGLETWFEPGKEVIVVESADEAIDRYRFLLSHDGERRALGEAARRRALAEHTFRHRAAQLTGIVRGYL